jgi:hypothetical protein
VRPAGFEPATPCLEGRRSFQLSYGRVCHSDSKTFVPRANTVLDALTFCAKGRRSFQLSYGRSLPNFSHEKHLLTYSTTCADSSTAFFGTFGTTGALGTFSTPCRNCAKT